MTHYLPSFLQGFLLMASVIFAIGPQNAMLIRQGLRRDHPFLVALIFTGCDFFLIALGVVGVGQYVGKIFWLRALFTYGGACFLCWFAARAFIAAWRGKQSLDQVKVSRRGTLVVAAFAVSLLNPGALIDTVVIIGSVSSNYSLQNAIAFGLGAQAFSTSFFFLLAGFMRRLAPTLTNPKAWRLIDGGVGTITLITALRLLFFEF